ncbi:MAG: hypothetical protein IC227_07245 [Enterococcus lacertideformus]|uniref:Glycosyl hydrolase n=1 Tax=Enterococcus lacertideformus TaxID=2771493 RepID=A0A931B2P8_9ENTE|nr:hypothetical protein [Enterococcus lacertideformus]
MDKEIFIIELISAKEKIMTEINKQTKSMQLKIVCYLLADFLFFYGLATMVYNHLQKTVIRSYVLLRVTNLYYFSLIVGLVVGGILFLAIILLELKKNNIFRHFDSWIEKRVTEMLHTSILSQDEYFIYLSEGNKKEIALAKKKCHFLMQTLEDISFYMGEQQSWNGCIRYRLFMKGKNPVKKTSKKGSTLSLNHLAVEIGLLLISFGGAYIYVSGGFVSTFPSMSMTKMRNTETHEVVHSTSEGLLKDPKKSVNLLTNQTNDLKLDPATKSLYMTTTQGKNWQFVPVGIDWIRWGNYTLTTGAVPIGYWMDKTFDISPDFTWFIYSPDEKNVYFLSSKDNGKTWQFEQQLSQVDNNY